MRLRAPPTPVSLGPLRGLWLGDGEQLVGGDLLEALHSAARPGDLDAIDDRTRPEAEVEPRIALRQVARAGAHVPDLGAPARGEPHPRTDGVAVAGRPDQAQLQPVVAIADVVAQQPRPVVDVEYQQVEIAVVVEVTARGSSADKLQPEC